MRRMQSSNLRSQDALGERRSGSITRSHRTVSRVLPLSAVPARAHTQHEAPREQLTRGHPRPRPNPSQPSWLVMQPCLSSSHAPSVCVCSAEHPFQRSSTAVRDCATCRMRKLPSPMGFSVVFSSSSQPRRFTRSAETARSAPHLSRSLVPRLLRCWPDCFSLPCSRWLKELDQNRAEAYQTAEGGCSRRLDT